MPIQTGNIHIDNSFTPRLRGCTCLTVFTRQSAVIYPASAGVYLTQLRLNVNTFNLPRACGGVPVRKCYFTDLCIFTPRLGGVYPTVSAYKIPCSNLPRARGDVPGVLHYWNARTGFTPRTWGCTRVFVAPILRSLIYPASAGVFLPAFFAVCHMPDLPRVCGGVP